MGLEQASQLWMSILGLGTRRLIALGLTGLAVLLVIGIGTYYLSQPAQEVLYSGLSREDVSRMGGVLKDAGLSFDVSSDGTEVTVPFGTAARARMLLAGKGLPESSSSGYELFNQLGSFGLTSFMQEVTKTRALEGELARTIMTIDGIKGARVHLVLPDRGSFRTDQQTATASVVIRTDNPSDTSSAQAIRHLVAAAVPDLKVENVTVLNTEGMVLASSDDVGSVSAGKMASVEQLIDREIEERIRKTLMPYLGIDNFRVSVTARLNTDRTKINQVIYDPSSRVERSVRTVKENALAQNTGPADAAATIQQNIPNQPVATGNGKNSNETNDRREELTNYEISSKTIETQHDGYVIEKLSIAILINKDRLAAAAKDGTDAVPVEHQLMDIEQLVSSAAGVSKNRGDALKVAAVSFVQDQGAAAAPAPSIVNMLAGQAGTVVNAIAVIVVAVLVILLGVRPAVRSILAARPAVAEGPSAAMLDGPETQATGRAVTAANDELLEEDDGPVNLIEDVTKRMNRSPQKRLEQIVEFDEQQAAAILRQWLRQEEAA